MTSASSHARGARSSTGRTAFVLSGGGSLGAVQVGMLRALAENGVSPDLLVGTSAGALNAAFVAGHGTGPSALQALTDSWTAVRRSDLFPVHLTQVVRSLGGGRGALCSDAGLRRLVVGHLTFELLEEAPIPLSVIATDLLTGEEVVLTEGDAASAVLASASVPGVLPAVRREGRSLVDGGLANNTAISQAVALGAERVVVLSAGFACALAAPPRSALGSAIQAVSLLSQQRLVADLQLYAGRLDVVVVPPPCPMPISPVDFARATDLVRLGHESASAFIGSGGLEHVLDPGLVGLHHHGAYRAAGSPGPGHDENPRDNQEER